MRRHYIERWRRAVHECTVSGLTAWHDRPVTSDISAGTGTVIIGARLRFGLLTAVFTIIGAVTAVAAALVLTVAVITFLLACCAAAGTVALFRLLRGKGPAAPLAADATEPIDLRLPVLELLPDNVRTFRSSGRP